MFGLDDVPTRLPITAQDARSHSWVWVVQANRNWRRVWSGISSGIHRTISKKKPKSEGRGLLGETTLND